MGTCSNSGVLGTWATFKVQLLHKAAPNANCCVTAPQLRALPLCPNGIICTVLNSVAVLPE